MANFKHKVFLLFEDEDASSDKVWEYFRVI